MKQSEKLDLILKALYEKRFDGTMYDFKEIMDENSIPSSGYMEVRSLAKRLESDSYIRAFFTTDGAMAELTSYGVEYCEEDSYSYHGSSIITNNYHTTISHSTGVSVVNASNNVNVSITNINDINDKLNALFAAVQASSEVTEDMKVEIIDCINEIKTSLSQDKKPKFALKSLLEMTSSLSGISSFALDLYNSIYQ